MKLPTLKKPKISKAQFKTSWERVPMLLCLVAFIVASVNFVWVFFFHESYEQAGIQPMLILSAVILLNTPTYIKTIIDARRLYRKAKRNEIKIIMLETLLGIEDAKRKVKLDMLKKVK